MIVPCSRERAGLADSGRDSVRIGRVAIAGCGCVVEEFSGTSTLVTALCAFLLVGEPVFRF